MKLISIITTALILIGGISENALAQFAYQGRDYKDLDVIMYDAETIERINREEKERAPSTQAPAPLSQTHPSAPSPHSLSDPASTPRPSSAVPVTRTPPRQLAQYPRDLSPRYTEIDDNIPLIINPKPCEAGKPDLDITVEDVEDEEGFIVADLHDDIVENFLDSDKVVLRIRATAHAGQTKFCLPLPGPGEYAVAIYHDKNDNRKFDKGFLKIPKEKFGMSNNPHFGLSAPDYEESAFLVPEAGAKLTIQLFSSGDILKRSNR